MKSKAIVMLILEKPCRQCFSQGLVGFYLCADQKTVILACDECEACWLTPEEVEAGRSVPVDREGVIKGTRIRSSGPGTRWATRKEIEAVGWGHLIASEYHPKPPVPWPGS